MEPHRPEGRLAQYAARILRPCDGKATIEVHDYHDELTSALAANLDPPAPRGRLPGSADPQYDLNGFLAAVDARTTARSDPDRVHDDAGIVVIGGFSQPATGGAGCIAAAREQVRQKSAGHRAAIKAQKSAGQKVTSADRRQKHLA